MECKDFTQTKHFFHFFIRIVPEWNVKDFNTIIYWLRNVIRIVPEWNVKTALGLWDIEHKLLESYQSGM